jgi:hypothetical protein
MPLCVSPKQHPKHDPLERLHCATPLVGKKSMPHMLPQVSAFIQRKLHCAVVKPDVCAPDPQGKDQRPVQDPKAGTSAATPIML